MKASHKGRLRFIVKVMCLDAVKIYGNRPKKLLNKINRRRLMKTQDLPLKAFAPRRVLNSIWRVFVINRKEEFIWLGNNQ